MESTFCVDMVRKRVFLVGMNEKRERGCDPLGNGMFRMVPSGDVVDYEERCRRLPMQEHPANDCMGLSWHQLAMKQGGLDTLDITRQRK